ncbi:MAG: HD domain-containing protein [Lachnospiraceae bacterium]|nr:HD domain-containing protein [Lachnospiraceae bacterium]
MEYISSKNIFLLLRDTLKLIDRRPMDHGSRTGYLFCKMLECKGGYEQYEIADFLMLATLHDIGAYKTDRMGDRLTYEFKEPMPHSSYGFLFLKNITPLESMARMVLYHRVPCTKIPRDDFQYAAETEILSLAEAAEVYHLALGEGFDHTMFRRQEGTFYSTEALDLLDAAVERFDVFSHLNDESYQNELDEILEYMIFTNEDKKKFIQTIMFCIGFRSETSLVDAVTSVCVSRLLSKKLNLAPGNEEKVYYASLIHDIGMLSIPASIIDSPKKLTKEEFELVKTHVSREEKILLNRMDSEVVAIATAHHERLDGSGYPKGLTDKRLSREQCILQLSDVATALTCVRPYRETYTKDEVIEILSEEAASGRLNKQITDCFIESYDEIISQASKEAAEALDIYKALGKKFKSVYGDSKNRNN